MEQKIREAVLDIINPFSQRKLRDEDLVKEITWKNDQLYVTYDRGEMTLGQKKLFENELLSGLKELLDPEQINIISKSDKSLPGNNVNPPKETQAANLKIGHGTTAEKKRVPGVGKLIAIGSGKGGVGKSTFTTNLAVTLANMGHKVGLIDADIYGPSVPHILGKKDAKPMANENKKMIPVESANISFISFGLFVGENEPVIWRGPMLGGVLNQFLFDVDWSGYDYLLIDLPPGTGDVQLSMVQNAILDGAIIISTPQDIALLDARKGLEMFRKLQVPIVGMVQNMSSFICDNCEKEHFIFGNNGVGEAVDALKLQLLGEIPLEIELRKATDSGVPYMFNQANSEKKVWKSYEGIANKVVDFCGRSNGDKKGFLSKLFSKGN